MATSINSAKKTAIFGKLKKANTAFQKFILEICRCASLCIHCMAALIYLNMIRQKYWQKGLWRILKLTPPIF